MCAGGAFRGFSIESRETFFPRVVHLFLSAAEMLPPRKNTNLNANDPPESGEFLRKWADLCKLNMDCMYTTFFSKVLRIQKQLFVIFLASHPDAEGTKITWHVSWCKSQQRGF